MAKDHLSQVLKHWYYSTTAQLTFMFVNGQQELFQSAGLYFIPFYLQIVDLF